MCGAAAGVRWKQESVRVALAGLGVRQIDSVVADVAPVEIEHFAPLASGERQLQGKLGGRVAVNLEG